MVIQLEYIQFIKETYIIHSLRLRMTMMEKLLKLKVYKNNEISCTHILGLYSLLWQINSRYLCRIFMSLLHDVH
jgi:aminopeptidase-like protein